MFPLSDMPVSGAFCAPATSLKGSVFLGALLDELSMLSRITNLVL